MQNENEQPLEHVEEDIAHEDNDTEMVSVPKSELTKIRRKAFAYDATKEKTVPEKASAAENVVPTTHALSEEVIEEKILLAEGLDADVVRDMKVIAKLRGITLLQTKKDPIIVALMAEREKEEKAKQASLGASRSSGKVATKKTFNTPGLSRAEHKALWKEHYSK